MAEYIERKTVKDKATYMYGFGQVKYVSVANIDKIPAADVAPVVRGKWKWNVERTIPFCSECAEVPWRENNRNLPNFCPNCGADMRVGEGEKLESHSKEDGEA